MKLRHRILPIVASGLLLAGVGLWAEPLFSAQAAPAFFQTVNVRGRIVRQVSARVYPAGRVRVRLKPVGGKAAAQTAYTASDGMYSFRNVTPGNYVIEVLGSNPERVLKSQTVQIPNRSLVDVPQLVL